MNVPLGLWYHYTVKPWSRVVRGQLFLKEFKQDQGDMDPTPLTRPLRGWICHAPNSKQPRIRLMIPGQGLTLRVTPIHIGS